MKNIILLILLFCLASRSFGQLGTNDYSSAVYNKISSFYRDVKSTFKDTLVLRRVETGILEQGTDNLLGSIQRKLFQGNAYLVAAFTDSRVKSYELKCYKKNTQTNNWDFVKSTTEAGTRHDDALLADIKVLSTKVEEDGTYMFEIVADKNTDNSTSRYAIMLWSKQQASTTIADPPPPNTTGNLNYSIDYLDYCPYDSVNKNFKNCTTKPDASSLMVLNAAETMFTHTTSDMKSNYYVRSRTYDKDLDMFEYQVVSDVGNSYTFYVPAKGTGYLSILSDHGNQSYLIKHHIKTSWKGQ